MKQHAKCLGRRPFNSKVIPQTHRHTPDRLLYLITGQWNYGCQKMVNNIKLQAAEIGENRENERLIWHGQRLLCLPGRKFIRYADGNSVLVNLVFESGTHARAVELEVTCIRRHQSLHGLLLLLLLLLLLSFNTPKQQSTSKHTTYTHNHTWLYVNTKILAHLENTHRLNTDPLHMGKFGPNLTQYN